MTSLKHINSINLLQKKCIRILNFGNFNCHTNALFHENKLLKLNDIVKNELIKLADQFKNNALPNDLNCIFLCNDNIYNTRNMNHGGLKVPIITRTRNTSEWAALCTALWSFPISAQSYHL